MLLTDPLDKCLPGGGDTPSIPEPKERSLSSTAGQGQGPSGGKALPARASANAWPAAALFGLSPQGVSVLDGQWSKASATLMVGTAPRRGDVETRERRTYLLSQALKRPL